MWDRGGWARVAALVLPLVAAFGLSSCSGSPDDTPYALEVAEGVAVFNAYYDLRYELTANPPLAVQSGSIGDALDEMEKAEASMDLPGVRTAAASIRHAVEEADRVGLEEIHGAPVPLLYEYLAHVDAFLATQESQGEPLIECFREAVEELPKTTPIADIQDLPESGAVAECLLAILPDAEAGTNELEALWPIMQELEDAWHEDDGR